MTDRQNRIMDSIYRDGERCFKKGLGIKSGRYDFKTMDRCIFLYIAYNDVRGFDESEIERQWKQGWFDAQDHATMLQEGWQGYAPAP